MDKNGIRYTTGQVCNILDITEGTIRFYEKKEIIKGNKYEGNGYRYYTFRDLNTLVSIRKYRNYGFSLQEIGELITNSDIGDIEKSMKNRIDDINEEIERLRSIVKVIEEEICKVTRLKGRIGKISLIEKEEHYFLPCQNGIECISNKELKKEIKKWFEIYDDVKPCSKLDFNKMGDNIPAEFGFSVDKDTYDSNEYKSECAKYYPKTLCVNTVIEVTQKHKNLGSFYEVLKNGIEFIEINNYELVDDVIGFKITTINDYEHKDYYELYYPIKTIV